MPHKLEQEIIDSVDLDWYTPTPGGVMHTVQERFSNWIDRVNQNPTVFNNNEIRITQPVTNTTSALICGLGWEIGHTQAGPGPFRLYCLYRQNSSYDCFLSASEIQGITSNGYTYPNTNDYPIGAGNGQISSSTVTNSIDTYVHFVECDNDGEEFFYYGFSQGGSTSTSWGFGIFRTTSGAWSLEGCGADRNNSQSRWNSVNFDYADNRWSRASWSQGVAVSHDDFSRPLLYIAGGNRPEDFAWAAASIEAANNRLGQSRVKSIGTVANGPSGTYYLWISCRGLVFHYDPNDLS